MARYWLKARRFLGHTVLHTDDSPHKIALGTGIAMFITFLPLVGFQMLLAVGTAALFRANKAVCVPIVWITNVFTIGPIYGACLALGRFVMSRSGPVDESAVIAPLEGQPAVGLFELAYWQGVLDRATAVALELWVGCVIVATVTAISSYFLARWGVVHFRERRRQRILLRNLRRANVAEVTKLRRSETA